MSAAGRPKGQAKTGGRIKGTSNKIQNNLRAMILQSLDEVGGVEYLAEQAKENPKSYLSLLAKIVPTEIVADIKSSVSVKHKIIGIKCQK